MRQPIATSLLAIAAAALAGCGGSEGDAGGEVEALATMSQTETGTAMPFAEPTAPASMGFVNQLIEQTSETSEPEPLDNKPLPTDESV